MGKIHIPHIKRHTQGSYNELSFDVLDAARNELDDKQRSRGNTPLPLKGQPETFDKSTILSGKGQKPKFPSLASLPAIQKPAASTTAPAHKAIQEKTLQATQPAPSQFSAEEEIARRKKKRRSHSLRIRALVIVLVLALVGVGVWFGYNYYQERQDFKAQFASLVSRFVETDETIVVMDRLMVDPSGSDGKQERARMVDVAPSLSTRLDAIATDSQKLLEVARDDKDTVALTQVGLSVAARKDMVKTAVETFGVVDKMETQVSAAANVWTSVMEADRAARDASEKANAASSKEATEEARDATQAAIEKFESSLRGLENLEGDNAGLSLKAQREYVQKRIDSLNEAVVTSTALLEGDRDSATAHNDADNQADTEAAKMAESLPRALDATVKSWYEEKITPIKESYTAARDTVSACDAIIRDYLGEQGK